jgi:hypothetical protein
LVTPNSRSEIPVNVLKCGAGEGWRRSFGPIVCEMKKYNIGVNEDRINDMQQKEGKLDWSHLALELPHKTRLFSWRYNPLWLYFPQPDSGL